MEVDDDRTGSEFEAENLDRGRRLAEGRDYVLFYSRLVLRPDRHLIH